MLFARALRRRLCAHFRTYANELNVCVCVFVHYAKYHCVVERMRKDGVAVPLMSYGAIPQHHSILHGRLCRADHVWENITKIMNEIIRCRVGVREPSSHTLT